MSKSHWKEALKRVSLLGLGAAQMEPALAAFFQKQNIAGEEAEQILAGISLLSLQERGQFAFKKIKSRPPLHPIPEDQKYISQHQNNLLAQILNKDFQWAMYELITQVKAQDLLIPAFRIPDLVDYALSETWFKAWILELTGRQGAWALSHIPAWEKKYNQIPAGQGLSPRSIEKKVFPLLNLKSPVQNLGYILDYLDFPALIWSEKFSKKMFDYLQACLKRPIADIRIQEDLDDLIHFASYMTEPASSLFFSENEFGEDHELALARYNQTLAFRQKIYKND